MYYFLKAWKIRFVFFAFNFVKPKDDLIINYFLSFEEDYPYIRTVKGDGNCFYRAIMFLFLRQANLNDVESLFPNLDLFKCYEMPLNNRDNVSSERLLYYIWNKYLQPLANKTPIEREEPLQKLMNSSQNLDIIFVFL